MIIMHIVYVKNIYGINRPTCHSKLKWPQNTFDSHIFIQYIFTECSATVLTKNKKKQKATHTLKELNLKGETETMLKGW